MATYYVDSEKGSDSNEGTSPRTAWAHLPGTAGVAGSGWAPVKSGDAIWVKGGTINDVRVQFTNEHYKGSASFDSIVVKSGHLRDPAWGQDRAVFEEENVRTSGFFFESVLGVTVEGFEIRNIAPGGVDGFDEKNGNSCVIIGSTAQPVQYITVRDCYLHDAIRNSNDRGHGIETGRCSYLIIEKNTVGPRIGTKAIEICTDVHHGAVRNNYVINARDHGIVISGEHWDVCNNVVYMIGPYAHPSVNGIVMSSAKYVDVWNNIVLKDDQTEGRNSAVAIFVREKTECIRVYHNTCYNFYSSNWGYSGTGIPISAQSLGNNDIQNSISYKCRNAKGYVQLVLPTDSPNNHVAFNNFFGANDAEVIAQVWSGRDTDTASFQTAAQLNAAKLPNGNTAADNVQKAPGLVGGELPTGLDSRFRPNTDYFALTEKADAAVRVTHNSLSGDRTHGYSSDPNKFQTDIRGVKRSNWSMGAYEWNEGAK